MLVNPGLKACSFQALQAFGNMIKYCTKKIRFPEVFIIHFTLPFSPYILYHSGKIYKLKLSTVCSFISDFVKLAVK